MEDLWGRSHYSAVWGKSVFLVLVCTAVDDEILQAICKDVAKVDFCLHVHVGPLQPFYCFICTLKINIPTIFSGPPPHPPPPFARHFCITHLLLRRK